MTAASSADAPRTYGDLRRWRDDTRWELVEGQAHAMTGPSWQHQAVTMGLSAQLLSYFRAHGCRVLPAPFDVRLPRASEPDDAIETVVQPDISVVCDPAKLDARGCRGAPDLVVEVLSPSTAGRDHLTKRALYERHGVREHWLVHPTDRIVTIHRQRGEGGFGPSELFEARGVQRMEGVRGARGRLGAGVRRRASGGVSHPLRLRAELERHQLPRAGIEPCDVAAVGHHPLTMRAVEMGQGCGALEVESGFCARP